jgi:outer membrane protein W
MNIIKLKFWQMFAVFALALLMFGSTYAQKEQWYGAFTYSVSIPTGDTKALVEEISWRGIGLDYRYMIDRTYSVGLNFGWNVLYERSTRTTQTENGAVTATSDRTLNAFPIMANIHYYFGERKSIRPYVGLNAGGYVMNQRFEIGVYAWEDDSWEWGIAPEAGVVIPVERDFGIMLNGKYNYALTGEDVFGTTINHSYWQVNAGFVWEP